MKSIKLIKKSLNLFLFTLFNILQCQEPHFFVIIPTFHNKDYCIENIRTMAEQTYTDWQAIIIVDGSSEDDDGTYDLLHEYIIKNNLESRVQLIQNTERRLALYNIYTAIHQYAEDDWVVVLYDGDDFFTTPDALKRIAQEYKNNSPWFTYGQYSNYPANTLGNCRPFPHEINQSNGYRSYPWIASHPRTFYAWLFKQIKLQDLLHNGKFFPMAWDVAFLPMLEMAGAEHISFIPDILYGYRHHANNDYAQNLALQLGLEKVIRSQSKYSKLKYKPLQKKNIHKMADIIIYSKDRPLQLEALLESINENVTGINAIKVIYKASSASFDKAFEELKIRYRSVHFINEKKQKGMNFKKITLQVLEKSTADYVVFGVDDNLVTSPINLSKAIDDLETTKAFGVFFRMGLNIHYCVPEQNNKYYETPPLIQLDEDTYAWQFGTGVDNYRYSYCSGDWRYPTSVDMSLYRKKEILKELSAIQFNNPNTLEGNWSCTIPKKMRKIGICFKTSKCINVPLNSVKDGVPLPNMNVTTQELLQKFNQGFKLDWKSLTTKTFDSVHVMHAPTYINR